MKFLISLLVVQHLCLFIAFFGLFLTLFTCVTTASKTSPLNGLKTMAYQEGKKKTSEVDTKLSTE